MQWIWHFPDRGLGIDYFMNPLPALAMVGMAVNDHWLKYAYPSWVTGKLSDFLGVFYFPIFLCALACLLANFPLRWIRGRRRGFAYINPPLMIAASALTAALMAAVKLDSGLADAIAVWFSNVFFPIRLVADPTDLLALLVLPLSYRYALEFIKARPPSASSHLEP